MTGDQYRPIVVAYRNGLSRYVSRMSATVPDGNRKCDAGRVMNLNPAVIVIFSEQPGANIIGVVDRIKNCSRSSKAGITGCGQCFYFDRPNRHHQSIGKDVQFELMLTIALVVMVIFLFLRNLAATVIPSIAVPLSIVGTFGVMYLLGYSLNNLTLMALTISTGFVVDDAIVMIENIDRYLEEGDSRWMRR